MYQGFKCIWRYCVHRSLSFCEPSHFLFHTNSAPSVWCQGVDSAQPSDFKVPTRPGLAQSESSVEPMLSNCSEPGSANWHLLGRAVMEDTLNFSKIKSLKSGIILGCQHLVPADNLLGGEAAVGGAEMPDECECADPVTAQVHASHPHGIISLLSIFFSPVQE